MNKKCISFLHGRPATGLLMMVFILVISIPHSAKAQSNSPAAFSFSLEKTGHGPALILIPGLYCSGDVWKETVAHFQDRYTCYSLTLPGFAGQPPIHADTLLTTIAREITRFIVQNKLPKPLLVGHSLGGWMALQVAVSNPGLLGGVICVSSGPFLPALAMGNGVTPDSARKIGTLIKGYMVAQTPEQIRASQQYTLPTMMRDSARVKEVIKMAVRCDPATQGEIMFELFSIDLRPAMNKVQCPVLVLGDWVSYKEYGATRENVLEKYQQQFGPATHVTIALSDNSKHFIMFDEPVWFFGEVDKFLNSAL
jgi:N-formylmaleamate deformylase